jgi:DNA polymerase-3 subunit alpha (Gram-positive type)
MPPYPNLISDSLLVNETIELLKAQGGFAPAVNVVDRVMNISSPEPNLARLLVSDLIETDPRLQLNDDTVELVENGFGNRELDETDFVVFDLETTGAKTPPCRVTEIGAYRVSGREITGEYQTLVNPEVPIPSFIVGLTNITDEMVKDAPKFAEIVSEFMEFVGDSVLVAHNAPFDMRFLNHEVSRIHTNYRVANQYLCTVRLSRKLLPEVDNHRLNTVANYYSIDLTNHHRASADALATAKIFINLLEKLDEKGVSDLAGARNLKKHST